MDLGTDIESAKNPRPEESPVRAFSAAYLHKTVDKYPIKLPKKKPRPIHLQAFIIRNDKGEFLLEKNIQGRLLGGFWSFPILETEPIAQQLNLFENKSDTILKNQPQKNLFRQIYQLKPQWSATVFKSVQHTFSHQKWQIELIEGFIADEVPLLKDKNLRWVAAKEFSAYPFAAPQKKMVDNYLAAKWP